MQLESLRAARFHGFWEGPKTLAWQKLVDWAATWQQLVAWRESSPYKAAEHQ